MITEKGKERGGRTNSFPKETAHFIFSEGGSAPNREKEEGNRKGSSKDLFLKNFRTGKGDFLLPLRWKKKHRAVQGGKKKRDGGGNTRGASSTARRRRRKTYGRKRRKESRGDLYSLGKREMLTFLPTEKGTPEGVSFQSREEGEKEGGKGTKTALYILFTFPSKGFYCGSLF